MAGAVAAAGVAGDEEDDLLRSIGCQWGSSGGGLGLPACGDELWAPYIGESRWFNGGRHHFPGQFGTTRASHSSFSPPRTPSSSRKPSPYSISIENHRRPETTLHRNLPPPRSSPPTTSSTTVDPSTTGRDAPAVQIHPRPPEAARSRRSPALVAGVPPPLGTKEEDRKSVV